MTTTWKQLKDGTWGVIGPAATVTVGATVTVTKKSGETSEVVIADVLWSGDGKAIGRIAGKSATKSATKSSGARSQTGASWRRRGGRYECEECGDYVFPGTTCWETGIRH